MLCGHGHDRALDHAKRCVGVGLEAGVARRVDDVDLAVVPLEALERPRQRHLPFVLVVVPVGDRRALLHRAEAVRLAGLEEHRLDERRLSHAAVADDGDVADLPGLRDWHRGGSSWRGTVGAEW